MSSPETLEPIGEEPIELSMTDFVRTTRLLKRADGNIKVTLEHDHFFELNEAAIGVVGLSLVQYADADPNGAYDLFRKAISHAAHQNAVRYETSKGIALNIVAHGEADTRFIAEADILEFLPGSYEGPLLFSLFVKPSALDVQIGLDEPRELLSLSVRPDNYT
jgi:hypothetical protein